MLHRKRLIRETSKFLNEEVKAVGIFDISLKWSRRNMNNFVGIGTYVGTKRIANKMDYQGPKRLVAAGSAVVASKLTKQMIYERHALRMGVTPIMLVAVTDQTMYILDWDGNHKRGEFHRILMEFDLQDSTIKLKKRGLVHQEIELLSKDRYSYAKIECNLGLCRSNKGKNRKVRRALKQR
ncbi:MAG: hypothetical protein ACI90V_007351 [Bacillariaceae sp.]|jgi:hypothetical protein